MFSLIQTCRLNNISPQAYLTWYLTECTKRGAAPAEGEIDNFLPHNLTPDTKEKLRWPKSENTAFGSQSCRA